MKKLYVLCAIVLIGIVTALANAQTSLFNAVYLVDKNGNEVQMGNGGPLLMTGAVTHISAALHIAGIANTVNVNCTAGCAGAGTHTAVSQTAAPWTISHIAAMVHVQISGRPGMAAHQAGTWTVDIGSGTVAISGGTISATQSGAFNVSAAQSGTWNIATAHIIGGSGHLAVTFAGGGHIAITQGAAALQVDCSNCSAASVVNVGHISGAVHIAGLINGGRLHIQGLGLPGQAHGGVLSVQGVTGMVAVDVNCVTGCSAGPAHTAVTQAGQWNVAHISGAVHVAGISNISTASPMACHSSSAFSLTANGVIAGANSGNRIFICGLLLLSTVAESVSIVEGSGSACATGTTAIIGSTAGALPVAASGGFSAIQPFPWIASRIAGNAVCLIKSGVGTVAGVITYRGAP